MEGEVKKMRVSEPWFAPPRMRLECSHLSANTALTSLYKLIEEDRLRDNRLVRVVWHLDEARTLLEAILGSAQEQPPARDEQQERDLGRLLGRLESRLTALEMAAKISTPKE